MKTLPVVFLLLFCAAPILAQPELDWTQTYGGEAFDQGTNIIQLEDGGYVILGTTQSFGAGNQDVWLIRIDENGEELWSHTYGGEGNDVAYGIIRNEDGGYGLAGSTSSFGEGANDYWLVVTDEDGDSLWSRTYGGENEDVCGSILQIADGGYLLSGNTQSFGAGSRDGWLVATDDEGAIVWDQTYGTDDWDVAGQLVHTNDDGYAFVGSTRSWGAGSADMWLVVVDVQGEEQWSETYGGGRLEYGHSIELTDDGGFVLGGHTESMGAGSIDFYLVVTDDEGGVVMSHAYGGEAADIGVQAIQTIDGGYAVTAYSTSFGPGGYDYWLLKADEDGEEQWSDAWGGNGGDRPGRLIQTSDGGFVIIGSADGFGAGGLDSWFVKTRPDPELGPMLWPSFADTSFLEDSNLNLDPAYFRENIYAPLDPDADYVIELVSGESVQVEMVEGVYLFTVGENWTGRDSIAVLLSLDDEPLDTAYQILTVSPLNDLPGQFSLLTPENEDVIHTWTATFTWDEAAQNAWEVDTVSYDIHFRCLNRGWENDYVAENLAETGYPDLEMTILAEWLELELAAADFNIEWWVTANDDSGSVESNEHFTFTIPTQSVHDGMTANPTEFSIVSIHPNPFNSTTAINYELPHKSDVSLMIYNTLGHKVAALFEGSQQPGFHTTILTAADLPSGLYFVRLEAIGHVATQKVMLIR